MDTRTKNQKPRRKPMTGARVQALCPAPPDWRVLMLLTDEEPIRTAVPKTVVCNECGCRVPMNRAVPRQRIDR